MFLSVIAAYVLATAFAFCGVVNTVGYIMESQQGMGSFVFMEGLAVAMWPLAVAMGLVMLVQIATQVERWRLLWTMAQGSSTAPAPATRPSPARPAPAPARRDDPQPAVTPPRLEELPTSGVEAIPLPPKPAPIAEKPAPVAEKPVPVAEKPQPAQQQGLNFFKLD